MKLDVLAVAPHPDDAELGMGGALRKMKKLGWQVGVLDLTSGEPTPYGSPEIRAEETRAATEILGLDWRDNLGLPNRSLQATLEARRILAQYDGVIVADEHESVTGDYLRSFRANFRQATLLGLAVLFLALVLGAWYVVAEILGLSPVVRFVLQAICYLVAFRVVLVALYAFPYLAKFENTVPEVLNNARKLSARHLFASLAVLVVTALPVVVTVFYPAATAYGLLWFLIGFAGIAFVNAGVFTAVESAAMAVLYALLVTALVYRGMGVQVEKFDPYR
jgi:uncharacterized membrane protein YesL